MVERGKLGFVGEVSWKFVWLIVSGNFYKSCMHSHIICIRVDAAAEGTLYEVIAGPQEQRGQVQQDNCEHPAQGPAESSFEQQPEGKPWCTSYYLKL